MSKRPPPVHEDLFAYASRRTQDEAVRVAAEAERRVQSLMARARRLARVRTTAPAVTRADGVVVLTQEASVRWARETGLEWPDDEGLLFKLGVADAKGALRSVCFAVAAGESEPGVSAPPNTAELAVVALPGDDEALAVALDRGARAALAMGYDRVRYYAPMQRGHAFDLFQPVAPRPLRRREGGSLAWRSLGHAQGEAWLRSAREKQARKVHAAQLRDQQVNAILAWEEAVAEAEAAQGGEPLSEEQESDLALEMGFDYYDGWRPSEFTDLDAEGYLDEAGFFDAELFELVAERPARPLLVRQIEFPLANETVKRWHSHLATDREGKPKDLTGHLFSLGIYARAVPGVYEEHLRAVAVASRPVARAYNGLPVLEVTRVATWRGAPPLVDPRTLAPLQHRGSEASFALARVREAADALGFTRVLSSILLGEAGASYRSDGWTPVAINDGGEWTRGAREREAASQPGFKVRWEAGPGRARPAEDPKDKDNTPDAIVREAAQLHKDGWLPLGGPRRGDEGPTKPNERLAWLRDRFQRERAAFARAFPETGVGEAALVLEPGPCSVSGACGFRDVAWASWLGRGARARRPLVHLLRRALVDLEPENLVAVLRHELGHLADVHRDRDGSERRADRVAEEATGERIYYDARDVQTTKPGTWPRPKHLHR